LNGSSAEPRLVEDIRVIWEREKKTVKFLCGFLDEVSSGRF
jgi:hypothetical protein